MRQRATSEAGTCTRTQAMHLGRSRCGHVRGPARSERRRSQGSRKSTRGARGRFYAMCMCEVEGGLHKPRASCGGGQRPSSGGEGSGRERAGKRDRHAPAGRETMSEARLWDRPPTPESLGKLGRICGSQVGAVDVEDQPSPVRSREKWAEKASRQDCGGQPLTWNGPNETHKHCIATPGLAIRQQCAIASAGLGRIRWPGLGSITVFDPVRQHSVASRFRRATFPSVPILREKFVGGATVHPSVAKWWLMERSGKET
ncbi:hypothetical protein ANO11243_092950 [Dothideomycetidae sp. 11243]|nr:hypothetical protein ANO11243_092950 [fungal sp. No.11243]